jgi:hypothetical protein
MEKLIIAIVFVFSVFTAQAQISKVNEFVNSLPKKQKGIEIFRFNSENMKDIDKLKDGDLFMGIKQLLPDTLLKDIRDLVICQIGTEQAKESKALESAIKEADLKTLYAVETDGVVVQMLTSTFEKDNLQDLLIDVKSEDNSRITVMLRGSIPMELTSSSK